MSLFNVRATLFSSHKTYRYAMIFFFAFLENFLRVFHKILVFSSKIIQKQLDSNYTQTHFTYQKVPSESRTGLYMPIHICI